MQKMQKIENENYKISENYQNPHHGVFLVLGIGVGFALVYYYLKDKYPLLLHLQQINNWY